MTESIFWALIENSWEDSLHINTQRANALKTNDKIILVELADKLDEIIAENYKKRLRKLNNDDLKEFMNIFREKLNKLDTDEILNVIGFDDGSLYARCFIIGMGEQYYNMIDTTPLKAIDCSAELFGGSLFEICAEKLDQ